MNPNEFHQLSIFFRTLLPRSMITTSTTLHVHHVAMRHGVHHDDGQQRMFLQLVNAITEDLARDRQERTESVGYFSRMRSKGSRFTLGVWGLRVCSLDVASASATLRNRSQPSATVRAIPVWPCLWEVLQRWSFLGFADVSLLRFAWQAWHFVTFRRVLERVESRCVAGAILL